MPGEAWRSVSKLLLEVTPTAQAEREPDQLARGDSTPFEPQRAPSGVRRPVAAVGAHTRTRKSSYHPAASAAFNGQRRGRARSQRRHSDRSARDLPPLTATGRCHSGHRETRPAPTSRRRREVRAQDVAVGTTEAAATTGNRLMVRASHAEPGARRELRWWERRPHSPGLRV